MEDQHAVPAETPRATRFPLRLRARYRDEPSGTWHPAMTVNVSRTGVLLRGQQSIAVGCVIDIVFRLSDSLLDKPSGAVFCQCRVVRTQPASEHADVLIAAEITKYDFARQQRFDEHDFDEDEPLGA
jgi:hypothetical protein